MIVKTVVMMMTMNVSFCVFSPCFQKEEEAPGELLVERSFVWKMGWMDEPNAFNIHHPFSARLGENRSTLP